MTSVIIFRVAVSSAFAVGLAMEVSKIANHLLGYVAAILRALF